MVTGLSTTAGKRPRSNADETTTSPSDDNDNASPPPPPPSSEAKRAKNDAMVRRTLAKDAMIVKIAAEGILAIKSLFNTSYEQHEAFREEQQTRMRRFLAHMRAGNLKRITTEDFRASFEELKRLLQNKKRAMNPSILKLPHMQVQLRMFEGIYDESDKLPTWQEQVAALLKQYSEYVEAIANDATKNNTIDVRVLYQTMLRPEFSNMVTNMQVFGAKFVDACSVLDIKV